MNLDKLTDELAKASAAKAGTELERMIKLHEEEVNKHYTSIKVYLQQVGTVPGKAMDYSASNSSMTEMVRNKIALSILQELKQDLK